MLPVERSQTMSKKTTQPIKPDTSECYDPEFVRVPQLYSRAGIKRGLTYRKINDGTFKSVVLREPGNKQGIRLVFWPSVKAYLHRLMLQQGQAMEQHEATVKDNN